MGNKNQSKSSSGSSGNQSKSSSGSSGNQSKSSSSVSNARAAAAVAAAVQRSTPTSAPATTSAQKKDNDKGIKIKGESFNVGSTLNANDLAEIQKKLPNLSLASIESRIKKEGIKIGPNPQSVFAAAAKPASTPSTPLTKDEVMDALKEAGVLDDSGQYVGAGSENSPGEEVISFPTYELTKLGSVAETNKEIERIRDAGETERLKYEIDNKIPLVQAEAKGKIDIQKIVNAGYENIENIKRGSDMVRNITSMFNF